MLWLVFMIYLWAQWAYFYCVCVTAQSCLTLCYPMDCSPPGSSVHGIFQARISYPLINISFYMEDNCLNWSIVVAQCCVSFRCTAQWFSFIYIYVYVKIFFKFFPPVVYYKILKEFPVLSSKLSFFIYFMHSVVCMQSPASYFILFPLPFDNHEFAFYVYESFSVL